MSPMAAQSLLRDWPHCVARAAINIPSLSSALSLVLVVALVERWTRDRKVAGSTRGRGAIKSTRSTQPSIPPG